MNAYRRMSRLYHPDKHTDPEKKREAEILFNKTRRIYDGKKFEFATFRKFRIEMTFFSFV